MNIEIQLSNDELVLINTQLQKVYATSKGSIAMYNVIASICFGLADTFDKKTKNRIKKSSLFDSKKKTKITLKYHEAFALKFWLYGEEPSITNEYQKTLINKQIANLDQKLT